MAYIIGVDDVSQKVKDIAVGVDGTAKFVKSAFVGVDGVARKFYQRGYYEKRLYFFGYTGSLGTEYLADKVYSVKTDGSAPVEYTLETPIYAFYTGSTNGNYFPAYATWANIKPAKFYYDPDTKRLCIVGFSAGSGSALFGNRIHFYTIDCVRNTIIDHQSVTVGFLGVWSVYGIYYSYEKGCVFFAIGVSSSTAYFVCYDIRNSTIKKVTYTPATSSGYLYIRGLFATPTNSGARLVCAYANNVWEYRDIQIGVFDFDLTNETITPVAQTYSLPTGTYGITFILPHSFMNKNQLGNPFGICFTSTASGSSPTANKGYVITKDGYLNTSFTITSSYVVNREFGFSNTHGAMWVQGSNGSVLGKYGTSYTSVTNPTGGMSNNSGKTYDGPVIGGGIITGYTDSNTAVIYANIAGSYYNITPAAYGAYNNPICEGVNLKEVLIPNGNQFLVYDFNQAAYTTPISVAGVMSQYNITPCPYVALLSWTEEEQNALVNLGY